MGLEPQQDTKTISASNMTGASGSLNRVYTLDTSDSISEQFNLKLNGAIYQPDVHFTKSGDDVTFLIEVFDGQPLTIDYWTRTEGPSIGVTYCTASDVQRVMQVKFDFATDTFPSLAQVNKWINWAEAKIDIETKHAWREVTIEEQYYDFPKKENYVRREGLRIKLLHRRIKEFDTSEGDKLEVWNGQEWEDWITAKTEGRADDFWVDYRDGVMYLRFVYPFYFHRTKAVRMTYRFGETIVPGDISDAAAMLVASKVVLSDDYSQVLSDTGDPSQMNHDSRATRWKNEANETILDHVEIVSV